MISFVDASKSMVTNRGLTEFPDDIPKEERKLNLSNNKLGQCNKFSQLGLLHCLRYLKLSKNLLSSIPSEIFHLSLLEECYLDKNQISSISCEISKLNKLRIISFHANRLTAIPAEFGLLIALQKVILSDNQLKEFPNCLTKLKSLQYLKLSKNTIAYLPSKIRLLENLEELLLDRCKLRSVPPEICSLRGLKRFHLDNNDLSRSADSDFPVESIAKLDELEELTLHNNVNLSLDKEIAVQKSPPVLIATLRKNFSSQSSVTNNYQFTTSVNQTGDIFLGQGATYIGSNVNFGIGKEKESPNDSNTASKESSHATSASDNIRTTSHNPVTDLWVQKQMIVQESGAFKHNQTTRDYSVDSESTANYEDDSGCSLVVQPRPSLSYEEECFGLLASTSSDDALKSVAKSFENTSVQ